MDLNKKILVLKKQFEKEKTAREKAEKSLTEKSFEYTKLERELQSINFASKNSIAKRDKKLTELAKFPNENPMPVVRYSCHKELLFANDSGNNLVKLLTLNGYENNKIDFFLKLTF